MYDVRLRSRPCCLYLFFLSFFCCFFCLSITQSGMPRSHVSTTAHIFGEVICYNQFPLSAVRNLQARKREERRSDQKFTTRMTTF
jgi:hypothetical protein